MKIISEKDGTIIADQVILADTFFSRFVGWMFKQSVHNMEAILLEPCNSIHTFFMRNSIDVIFLDKDNLVIYLKKEMVPYSFTPIFKNACKVIEFKLGTISHFNICAGDKINVLPK